MPTGKLGADIDDRCVGRYRVCGSGPLPRESATSGLPIPRFVSLKSDKVNVRAGPTKDHDVTWVYTRSRPAGRNHRRI